MRELFLLDGDAEDGGWQERALCAQTDPEAFFPEKGGSTREAKKVCLTCDVRNDCLESALMNDERFGIWLEEKQFSHGTRPFDPVLRTRPVPGGLEEHCWNYMPVVHRKSSPDLIWGRPDERQVHTG